MADLNFKVATGETSITSAAKTVVLIGAPPNQRVKIKGFSVWAKGVLNTDTPVKIELIVAQSVSGGTPGSVVVSKPDGDLGETVQSNCQGNYAAEPTYTGPIITETLECHPQSGFSTYYPLHDEIKLKGGTVFAIRLTANQTETMAINVLAEE